jgi:hypothetical protein
MFRNRHHKRKAPWVRRRQKALLYLGVFVVLLGGFSAYRMHFRMRVESALDAIRAEGYPATPAELDAWYPQVPKEENAAPLYLAANVKFPPMTPDDQDLLPAPMGRYFPESPNQPYSEETRELSRQILLLNLDTLALLHEAAQRPACRFPIDLSKGFEVELPHSGIVRRNAHLLVLAIQEAAEAGDAETVQQRLMDLLAISHALRNEPLFNSQLIRASMVSSFFEALNRVLNRKSFSEDQCISLAEAIMTLECSECRIRALVGEGCINLDAIVNYSHAIVQQRGTLFDGIPPEGRRWAAIAASALGFRDIDALYAVDILKQLRAFAALPFPDCLEVEKAISADDIPRMLAPLTLMLGLPSQDRIFISFANAEAYRRIMLAALAVERFRINRGFAPERLEELVPDDLDAIPQDPFDGQPLRYRRDESHYTVYSVGWNRRDNGGLLPEPELQGRRRPPDIIFPVFL